MTHRHDTKYGRNRNGEACWLGVGPQTRAEPQENKEWSDATWEVQGVLTLAVAAAFAATTPTASAGSLQADGQLDLTISVRGVPTQADLDQVQEQVRSAQLRLCNATDGLVKLTKVTVTPRPASEQRADVWWYPQPGRESATLGGLETTEGRVLWFGTAADLVGGIENFQSLEERPGRRGIAFGLDGGTLAHELGHYVLGLGDEYGEGNRFSTGCGVGLAIEPSLLDSFNNSLLQFPGQVCVNHTGQTHQDFGLALVPIPCLNDEQCTPLNDGVSTWTCQGDPRGRELSVDGNFDTVLSAWRYGGVVDACPSPRAATDVFLHAFVRVTGVPSTTLPNFEAPFNTALTNVRLQSLRIHDALGQPDSLHALHAAVIKYQLVPTPKIMLVLMARRDEYLAPPANVVVDDPDTSLDESQLFVFARFALEYSAEGVPVRINGVDIDAMGGAADGSYPEIELGGVFPPPSFGVETDGAPGQPLGTSAFVNAAAAVRLRLHLENILDQDYVSHTGEIGNSAFIVSDPRVGLVATRAESNGLTPQLACSNPDYCLLYDSSTGDYEGSSHSLIQLRSAAEAQGVTPSDIVLQKQAGLVPGERVPMRSGWGTFFDRYGTYPTKANGLVSLPTLPEEPATVSDLALGFAECGAPGCGVAAGAPCEAEVIFDSLTVPDEFVIVLDRSGSMETPMSASISGVFPGGTTRLAYAQAAARSVLNSFMDSDVADPLSPATRVGLVAFDDVAATVTPTTSTLIDVFNAIGTITTDGGFTAIAAGMDQGLAQLMGTPATGAKALLLLSDGENNRPCDCLPPQVAPGAGCMPPDPGLCDPAALPAQAAARLGAAGVQLYTVPMGEGADRSAYAELAALADGQSFDSVSETEVIPNFMLAYIAFRGAQPLVAKSESLVIQRAPRIPKARQTREEELFPLPVESGARQLQLLLSVRDSDPYYWSPRYELLDPSGSPVVTQTGVSAGSPALHTVDPFYHLITVPSPEAGEWQLRILAPSVGTTRSFVTGYVENPVPDCFVDTFPGPIVNAGQSVEIRASASQALPLEAGAGFGGELRRPDGGRVPLSFVQDPNGPERFIARVPASDLIGTGTYSAEVVCQVEAGATPVQGEGDDPPNTLPTGEPFERSARAQFFLQSSVFPPSTSGDADGDGIPDAQEPPGDLDEDGLPNDRDSDADGDELSDGLDPGPFDSGVTGRDCPLTPDNVGCCTDLSRCGGSSGYVLYALDKLAIADRSQVSPSAHVASAGTETTQLGVEAVCGTIYSVPDVLLQNFAQVEGDVYTGELVEPQLGSSVSGGVLEETTLSLPRFDSFWVTFPPLDPLNALPDLGLEDNLEPGRYGQVQVDEGTTLRLFSGSYFIDAFNVDGTIELDPSQGPIFLYVRDQFAFRGVQAGANGSELLLAYLGSQPVAIERAFKGTIVAPYAQVNIGPANEGTQLFGAVFASRIFIQPDVHITHIPFPLPWGAGAGGLQGPSPCNNGQLDAGETGVDCGGTFCGPCAIGLPCNGNQDCASSICVSNVCAEAPPSNLELAFVPFSDWGGGYCGALNVTNAGAGPVSGWTASLNLNGASLNTAWNVSTSGSSGLLNLTASPSNEPIQPGATNGQAGLCATRPSGGSALPQVLSITGVP